MAQASRFNLRMDAKALLFPFRYRDEPTGKWVRARYKASLSDIAARNAEWEITGPGEARQPIGSGFNPYRDFVAHAELKRLSAPPLQFHPHLQAEPAMHASEVFLVRLFRRRYVTYCARRGRSAQMNGAAELFRELPAATLLAECADQESAFVAQN